MEDEIAKLIESSDSTFELSELTALESLTVLKAVYFSANQQTRITLKGDKFIDPDILRKFDNSFAKLKIGCIFNISEKPYSEIVLKYLIFIAQKTSNNNEYNESLMYFEKDFFSYDADTNKIYLTFPSVKIENDFKKIEDNIKTRFIKYGFAGIDIVSLVDETINTKILESIKKKDEEIAKQKPTIKTIPKPTLTTNFKYKKGVSLDKPNVSSFRELKESINGVVIHGKVFDVNIKEVKNGTLTIVAFSLTDNESAIPCKIFYRDNQVNLFGDFNAKDPNHLKLKEYFIKPGDWVAVAGDYAFESFSAENVLTARSLSKIKDMTKKRVDSEPVKRVELHTHTKMSAFDGMSSSKDYLQLAADLNMEAIAFTDHLNVHEFPLIQKNLKEINNGRENKIKAIYGCEVDVLDKNYYIVKNELNSEKSLKECTFVAFDTETTGLYANFCEIIEFGAVKFNISTGLYEQIDILFKPEKEIPANITELTNITNEMVSFKKTFAEEVDRIIDFIGDSILVIHNAPFDMAFMDAMFKRVGKPVLKNNVIDTLTLSRAILDIKKFKLGSVAKKYFVNYDESIAHRADYDAIVLKDIFENMYHDLVGKHNVYTIGDLKKLERSKPISEDKNISSIRGKHVTLLAKNQEGLKDLYKIVSYSFTDGFVNSPKITWDKINEFNKNKNLLLSSPCEDGEIFAAAQKSDDDLAEVVKKYDYVEVQPLSSYEYLADKGEVKREEIKEIIKRVIKIAKQQNVLICATSGAHYTNPELKRIKQIFIKAKGLKGARHPLFDFKNRIKNFPNQHVRTTSEMLEEFKWLNDEKLINEIVIENTIKISNMIDQNIKPVKDKMYAPKLDNVENNLRELCYQNAHKTYGKQLPDIVKERLDFELNAITGQGYAVVYWISSLLVQAANNNGWLVGSRGSVGSSIAATFSKITEVNPLKPHYLCTNCTYSDFSVSDSVKCGFDLPIKNCPNCNTKLRGEGHDIPFETFLGFDGDKVPDIDLNFPGDFQSKAHDLCKEIFGEQNCFRAGTISTVAERSVHGLIKEYNETANFDNKISRTEAKYIVTIANGVKKTTGKHAGGVIILPKEYEIEDFTPVNFPADEINSSWKTTHFDFNSIHDNLLKLDLLGHIDPVVIHHLEELTGVDPLTIPYDDEKVYSLFTSSKELNIDLKNIREGSGAIGLPEFGTRFARGVLKQTQPTCFSDLVKISGLTHGTDVYANNAENLIKEKKTTLRDVIGCRDDIMVYLISKGVKKINAFNIMESVRKGKGLKDEWVEEMTNCNVPDWYIESCNKIKYLFPKGHATAYVTMAYRITWYKLYYPEEFYAVWLTHRPKTHNIDAFYIGKDFCLSKIKEFLNIDQIESETSYKSDDELKKEDLIYYELIYEAYLRGVKFKMVSFEHSEASRFRPVVNPETGVKEVYLPFIVIDSLGESIANSIVEARELEPITSLEDLEKRCSITKTVMKLLIQYGATSSLKQSNQLTFNF